MAFSNTLLKKETVPGGYIYETHSWNGDSVTTGTITCDTTIQPGIAEVLFAIPSNDADNNTAVALDGAQNTVKLTFTTSDTGKITIVGKAR